MGLCCDERESRLESTEGQASRQAQALRCHWCKNPGRGGTVRGKASGMFLDQWRVRWCFHAPVPVRLKHLQLLQPARSPSSGWMPDRREASWE